jgi:hypothetical protein
MPRKVFVAGEILTAADVNTNLMDQAVMVFDDSAARGSAIPSPSEGMVTYLKDTNQVQAYDGSAFAPLGTILQVVSVTKTDTFTTASTSNVNITGLSASITPTSNTSKIFVTVNAVSSQTATAGTRSVLLSIARGDTVVLTGDASGSRPVAGNGQGPRSSARIMSFNGMSFLDSPATTSALTYNTKMRVTGGTGTINRSGEDPDNNDGPRSASTITLMEVAG